MTSLFDNRELALLIWLLVVAIYVSASSRTRPTLLSLVEAVEPKLLLLFTLFAGYGVVAAWLLASLGLWNEDLISETVLWVFGPGIVLLSRVVTRRRAEGFFPTTLRETVRLTIAVEVLIGLYPMHLLLELLLIPVIVLLSGASASAERDERLRHGKSAVDFLLALIGFSFVGYTIAQIGQEPSRFFTADTGRAFLLPVLLTLAFVPFLYLVGLVTAYESAFSWIDFKDDNSKRRWMAKLALIAKLRGRTSDVKRFNMPWGRQIRNAPSFRTAYRKVAEFQDWARDQRLAPIREAERLERYAGVAGTDDEGRQLDQREFDETKKALRWLGTAQMGWYRNRGGRYREELLEVLQSQFTRDGLPDDHNITLHVSSQGQAWWAWRQTITGWCFGIGASGPPPDEWLYEGPQPPKGPPGSSEGGWSQWGVDSPNW